MIRKLLILLALMMPGVAHADWYEADSKHFVVYSDDKPEHVKKFATDLERFDKAMRVNSGLEDPPVGPASRVSVYVLGGVGDVARLAHSSNVAGFYEPRASGSVAFVPRYSGTGEFNDLGEQAILFHEYAHHFMFTNWPNAAYPAWFAEGFAEFNATARMNKDGSVTIGGPPQYRAEGILSDDHVTLTTLLNADPRKFSEAETNSMYGRGWLFVHFMIFDPKRQAQLSTFLKAIDDGKTPQQAQGVFGDLTALDREMTNYARHPILARTFPADRLAIGEVTLRKLRPGEAAILPVRIRSTRGVDQKSAPGVYADAKKAAAPYPDDQYVQVTLAEAAHDAGDYAGCETAADRAIAADAKLVRAYDYKAMCRMAVAIAAKDKRPETWTPIRKIIAAGNHADPEDPMPLILYYQSFVSASVPPTDAAKKGLDYAFVLAPEDPGLRLSVAAMYLRDRKVSDARDVLKPLAFAPHGGAASTFARGLIEMIDEGDGAKALKQLQSDDNSDSAADPGTKGKSGG